MNVALSGDDKTACDMKKTRGVTSNEPRKLDPMVLDTSRESKGDPAGNQRPEQHGGGPDQWQGKAIIDRGAVGNVQKQLRVWWSRAVDLKNKGDVCAVHVFVNTKKKLMEADLLFSFDDSALCLHPSWPLRLCTSPGPPPPFSRTTLPTNYRLPPG